MPLVQRMSLHTPYLELYVLLTVKAPQLLEIRVTSGPLEGNTVPSTGARVDSYDTCLPFFCLVGSLSHKSTTPGLLPMDALPLSRALPMFWMKQICVNGTRKWDGKESHVFQVNGGRDRQEYENLRGCVPRVQVPLSRRLSTSEGEVLSSCCLLLQKNQHSPAGPRDSA